MLKIDGKTAKVPTVLKIAFEGQLDKYRHIDESLLGETQNLHEASIGKYYHIIRPRDDGYETNESGIIPNVIENSHDGSYNEMLKADNITKGEFQNLTKNAEFPKGIKYDDFMAALINEHESALGRDTYEPNHAYEHPLTQQFIEYMHDHADNPREYVLRNLGKFTHPVTGKQYVVLGDYGANGDTLKQYGELRKRMRNRF